LKSFAALLLFLSVFWASTGVSAASEYAATPDPVVAQQLSAVHGSCPQYESAFKKYGLPVKEFSKIAYRESRCNPKSVSAIRKATGRPDVGLVQISGSWSTVTKKMCHVQYQEVIKALTTVDCNLKVAAYLYHNGGLHHWKVSSGK
jgi:hypothetical protein